MSTKELYLARKYALAFMNTYSYYDQPIDFLLRLRGIVDFLTQYRDRFFYGGKDRYLQLFKSFGFDVHAFGSLLELLCRSKRLALIKAVIKMVCSLYEKHNAIDFCMVTSSHPVSDFQLQQLNNFLEKASDKKILYSHHIDKSLIAGIRARGTTFMWEDSIAQRLRLIEQSYEQLG